MSSPLFLKLPELPGRDDAHLPNRSACEPVRSKIMRSDSPHPPDILLELSGIDRLQRHSPSLPNISSMSSQTIKLRPASVSSKVCCVVLVGMTMSKGMHIRLSITVQMQRMKALSAIHRTVSSSPIYSENLYPAIISTLRDIGSKLDEGSIQRSASFCLYRFCRPCR